jgi:hypothetical protein
MTNRTRLAVAVLGLAGLLAGLPGAASAAGPARLETARAPTPHAVSARALADMGSEAEPGLCMHKAFGAGRLAPAAQTTTTTAFPTTIPLPNAWLPEGIAIGPGPVAYFGSRADGSIYLADLRTGQGRIFSKGPGTPSLGLKLDGRNRLFVAGGSGGDARVLDARTGAVLASYKFTTDPAFVNDVIITPKAAWFTDSRNPFLYALPFGRNGRLPPAGGFVAVPLRGDIVYGAGNNANGIARTPDGRALLIVQSNTGLLFRVDPDTGIATKVDLGGELLLNGDGLWLHDRLLYVVQNRMNTVVKLRLDRAGTSGTLLLRVGDQRFDTPTTIAEFRDRLYLPNARFTTTPMPDTPYNAVAIRRP